MSADDARATARRLVEEVLSEHAARTGSPAVPARPEVPDTPAWRTARRIVDEVLAAHEQPPQPPAVQGATIADVVADPAVTPALVEHAVSESPASTVRRLVDAVLADRAEDGPPAPGPGRTAPEVADTAVLDVPVEEAASEDAGLPATPERTASTPADVAGATAAPAESAVAEPVAAARAEPAAADAAQTEPSDASPAGSRAAAPAETASADPADDTSAEDDAVPAEPRFGGGDDDPEVVARRIVASVLAASATPAAGPPPIPSDARAASGEPADTEAGPAVPVEPVPRPLEPEPGPLEPDPAPAPLPPLEPRPPVEPDPTPSPASAAAGTEAGERPHPVAGGPVVVAAPEGAGHLDERLDPGSPQVRTVTDAAGEPWTVVEPRQVQDADDHPVVPPPRRTGRWLLATLLGAIALAWVFPLAVAALRELVSLT